MVFTYGGLIFFLMSLLCHVCLSYYVLFSKLALVLSRSFSLLFLILIMVSSFHCSSHLIVVSIHSIIYSLHHRSLLYIIFHPLFMSLCFYIIMFHSIPSSSSLSVLHYHNDASCYDLHLTASSEFSSFNTMYHFHFFLTPQRTRMAHTCNIFISLLILLSGDIQSNP